MQEVLKKAKQYKRTAMVMQITNPDKSQNKDLWFTPATGFFAIHITFVYIATFFS